MLSTKNSVIISMSNSTDYGNETLNDNYDLAMSARTGRYALAVLLTLVYFVVLIANYGIIYYEWEAPDLYRTLINKLVPQTSVHNMLLATIFLPTLSARLLLPNLILPRPFCLAKRFCYISVGVQLILTYNEIAWLRYFYLGLGNMGSINEDLVGRFLIVLNVLIGTCLAAARIMLPGAHHDLQKFCLESSVDEAVEDADNAMTKVVLGTLLVATVVSYSSAAFKVSRRKRKITHIPTVKGSYQAKLSSSLLIDLSLSFPLFGLVLAITSLGCTVSYVMEGQVSFKFFIRMSFMLIIVIFKPMTIYLKKPRVRQWLGREVSNWMENFNIG